MTTTPIQFIKGTAITSRWGQWYRHDQVVVDGKTLEGFIQVKRRYLGKKTGHRIEAITCYKSTCVLGSNWQWLARQNGIMGLTEPSSRSGN